MRPGGGAEAALQASIKTEDRVKLLGNKRWRFHGKDPAVENRVDAAAAVSKRVCEGIPEVLLPLAILVPFFEP